MTSFNSGYGCDVSYFQNRNKNALEVSLKLGGSYEQGDCSSSNSSYISLGLNYSRQNANNTRFNSCNDNSYSNIDNCNNIFSPGGWNDAFGNCNNQPGVYGSENPQIGIPYTSGNSPACFENQQQMPKCAKRKPQEQPKSQESDKCKKKKKKKKKKGFLKKAVKVVACAAAIACTGGLAAGAMGAMGAAGAGSAAGACSVAGFGSSAASAMGLSGTAGVIGGAAINGAAMGGFSSAMQGENPLKGAMIGAASGGLGAGVYSSLGGSALGSSFSSNMGLSGASGEFVGNIVNNAVSGGISGGIYSTLNGGNFLDGAAQGALSDVGYGIAGDFMNYTNFTTGNGLLDAGIQGGFGSMISGEDPNTGFISSAMNYGLNMGADYLNLFQY